MLSKVIAFIPAVFLIGVGGLWTAEANGWVGDAEPSKAFAMLGAGMLGLGVALLIVIAQSLFNRKR